MAPTPPQFDGFEEVALPDVEEEEEPPKIPTASKSKRRKEMGVQNHDKVHQIAGDYLFFMSFLCVLAQCGAERRGSEAVGSRSHRSGRGTRSAQGKSSAVASLEGSASPFSLWLRVLSLLLRC